MNDDPNAPLPWEHPLVIEAKENPFRLFTADELRVIIGKSINFVFAAKATGAPFPGGVTRPEWFNAWLLQNPGFKANAESARGNGGSGEEERQIKENQ